MLQAHYHEHVRGTKRGRHNCTGWGCCVTQMPQFLHNWFLNNMCKNKQFTEHGSDAPGWEEIACPTVFRLVWKNLLRLEMPMLRTRYSEARGVCYRATPMGARPDPTPDHESAGTGNHRESRVAWVECPAIPHTVPGGLGACRQRRHERPQQTVGNRVHRVGARVESGYMHGVVGLGHSMTLVLVGSCGGET
jgi:hypothetical protein